MFGGRKSQWQRDMDRARRQMEYEQRQRDRERRQAEYAARESEREQARYRKEGLISQAKKIAYSIDWKTTGDIMRSLMSEWKSAGNAGRDHNDSLWSRFQDARQVFFDRREEHFKSQNAQHGLNKSKKEQLVREAESLKSSTDWRGTPAKFKSLMDRWKQVGSAGRDNENALWQRFRAAQDAFFKNRESYLQANEREKKRLVSEALTFAYSKDWRKGGETKRSLMAKWKSIGPAGKQADDRLWREFKSNIDTFFSEREKVQKANVALAESLIREVHNATGQYTDESGKNTLRRFDSEWNSISREYLGNEFRRLKSSYDSARTGLQKSVWGMATERGYDTRGRIITEVSVGRDGYLHKTRPEGKAAKDWKKMDDDHTTGHVDGKLHHHGNHRDGLEDPYSRHGKGVPYSGQTGKHIRSGKKNDD